MVYICVYVSGFLFKSCGLIISRGNIVINKLNYLKKVIWSCVGTSYVINFPKTNNTWEIVCVELRDVDSTFFISLNLLATNIFEKKKRFLLTLSVTKRITFKRYQQRWSIKKMLLKVLQNSQENICVGVSFLITVWSKLKKIEPKQDVLEFS